MEEELKVTLQVTEEPPQIIKQELKHIDIKALEINQITLPKLNIAKIEKCEIKPEILAQLEKEKAENKE